MVNDKIISEIFRNESVISQIVRDDYGQYPIPPDTIPLDYSSASPVPFSRPPSKPVPLSPSLIFSLPQWITPPHLNLSPVSSLTPPSSLPQVLTTVPSSIITVKSPVISPGYLPHSSIIQPSPLVVLPSRSSSILPVTGQVRYPRIVAPQMVKINLS